jgi:hypothetical protein
MTDMSPAPAPVTSETVSTPENSPAAPAEKVQSPEQSSSPQASNAEPAGNEQHTPEPEKVPEQPSEADLRRKARNQERWRRMKEAERENTDLRARLNLLAPRQIDYSQITDPEEVIAEKAVEKFREVQRQETEHNLQSAQQREAETIRDAWDGIKADMRERVPDFDAVVNDRTPIHELTARHLIESEMGGEIAYWLGKNPEAAQQLFDKCRTAPRQALIELGRIEAKLSAPPPKSVTKAPPPAPILNGGQNPMQFDASRTDVDGMAKYLRDKGIIN